MSDRLITHIRHVDLAVPDFAERRDFYPTTWGLTEVVDENRAVLLGGRRVARAVHRPAPRRSGEADGAARLRAGLVRRGGSISLSQAFDTDGPQGWGPERLAASRSAGTRRHRDPDVQGIGSMSATVVAGVAAVPVPAARHRLADRVANHL